MEKQEKSRRAWGLWCLVSLALAYFHEPWRAEAQTWLVARTADSLGELIFRSAVDGAGPLYYLWIWPWAKLFPGAFPSALFWLSWTGTALAVLWLLRSSLVPFRVAALVVSGYLLGYEYATQARPFGWGMFLLVAAFHRDRSDDDRVGLTALVAACWVHVVFVFPVLGWCVYRVLSGASIRRYLPVALAVVFLAVPIGIALPASAARDWLSLPDPILRLGSSLSATVAPASWSWGWFGLVLGALAFFSLNAYARIGFAAGVIPFLALFLFRYEGEALARHGGGLFLLWVMLAALSKAWSRPWPQRWGYGLLALSTVGAVVSGVWDLARPYSNGLAAARVIEAAAKKEQQKPRIVAVDEAFGTVVAARLNEGMWSVDSPIGCPYFPGKCPDTLSKVRDSWSRLEASDICPKGIACFFVARSDHAEPFPVTRGRWDRIFEASPSVSGEDLVVFQLSRR